ncbi:MAG: hypothetical protein JWL72_1243 [Ilumatobacteraceae bacterium]|nr:hypothetical protein [Ilumatobacteraceae bacterium]
MSRITASQESIDARPSGSELGRPPSGVVAVVVAFVGLSLGSTIAKASGAPGAVVAFWRFVIGAALWHVIVAIRGVRSERRRTVDPLAWRLAALPGVAFGVNLTCFFSGVDRTPIAHAEIINALTPLVMIPVAAVVLGERIERYVVGCGLAAITGMALVLSRTSGGGTSYVGDGLVVVAVLAWVGYLVRSKSVRSRVDTVDFMAVMSTVAAATTLPVAWWTGRSGGGLLSLSPKAWVLVAVLAIVAGMIAHGLIAWSQGRVPVGTISVLQLAQPGLGVLWAATFLGESVAVVQIVGMVIVLGAVGLIMRRSTAPEAGGDGGRG